MLQIDPALKVFPAHDYKGRSHSTIGQELADNPRLQKRDRGEFVEMMRNLNLSMPTHVTEALRTNMTGGKTIAQLLADAAAVVPFMALAGLKALTDAGSSDHIVHVVALDGGMKAWREAGFPLVHGKEAFGCAIET